MSIRSSGFDGYNTETNYVNFLCGSSVVKAED